MDQTQGKGPGIFITFEGGDGAGKTTHVNFLAQVLRRFGYEVLCLREPGGTSIGESLRSVVLNSENSMMANETELLIYEAARAQIVREVIIPALAEGKVVLCDRFYDSTVAYQHYGRGLSLSFVRQANAFACQGVHPCRTILLTADATVEEGLDRATHHGDADRLEQAGVTFHGAVNDAFLKIAAENEERIRVVSSGEPKNVTARKVFAELADIFGWDMDADFPLEFFDPILNIDTSSKAVIEQEA